MEGGKDEERRRGRRSHPLSRQPTLSSGPPDVSVRATTECGKLTLCHSTSTEEPFQRTFKLLTTSERSCQLVGLLTDASFCHLPEWQTESLVEISPPPSPNIHICTMQNPLFSQGSSTRL